jgi:hypothetical protein
MNPYPFWALNHVTVARAMLLISSRPGDASELVGERNRQHVWCSRFLAASIHGLSP